MKSAPNEITPAKLDCVVMPNGEVICDGWTLGGVKALGKFVTPKSQEVEAVSVFPSAKWCAKCFTVALNIGDEVCRECLWAAFEWVTLDALIAECNRRQAVIEEERQQRYSAERDYVRVNNQRLAEEASRAVSTAQPEFKEIKCLRCGEDLRYIDGQWVDRETHSTCDLPGDDTKPHAAPPVDDFGDIYVPGCWRCEQCGFELSKQSIFVASGNIACSRDDVFQSERCPNDGEMMRPVMWRERAEQNREWGTKLMEDIIALTGTQSLHDALDRIRQLVSASRAVSPEPPVRDFGEATEYGDRICPDCNQQVPRFHGCPEASRAVFGEPTKDTEHK